MDEIQTINLSDYTQIGEGGNGKTYVSPAAPGEILKVNHARLSTWEAVKREYDVSRAVAELGIEVPAMYRIVRVDDPANASPKQTTYATVSQRIEGKRSLSRICHDEPQRTEEMARLLCRKGKELFATECNTAFFPSRREQALLAVERATFVSRRSRERLRAFVRGIADDSHCLHGDFQTGNLIQAGEKYYWIDLDRFGHGDPMFDIGHLFLICHVYAHMSGAGPFPPYPRAVPPPLGRLRQGIHRAGRPRGLRRPGRPLRRPRRRPPHRLPAVHPPREALLRHARPPPDETILLTQ